MSAAIMDYPQAWEFVRGTKPEAHHERCSWRTQNGALLCDCDVLWDEYVRRGGMDPRAVPSPSGKERDLIQRGEALLSDDRQTEPRFDVFTSYAVYRLREALGYPASDYSCGAAYCDDPACNTHGRPGVSGAG